MKTINNFFYKLTIILALLSNTDHTYSMSFVAKKLSTKVQNCIAKYWTPKQTHNTTSNIVQPTKKVIERADIAENSSIIAIFRLLSQKSETEIQTEIFNNPTSEYVARWRPKSEDDIEIKIYPQDTNQKIVLFEDPEYTLKFNSRINTRTISATLKSLLHEYRHYQQRKFCYDNNVLIVNDRISTDTSRQIDTSIPICNNRASTEKIKKMCSPYTLTTAEKNKNHPFWQITEYDADDWAISQIQCPTCRRIIALHYAYTSIFGHWSFFDYLPAIKQSTTLTRCPAHTKRSDVNDPHTATLEELEKLLSDFFEGCQKMIEVIEEIGKTEETKQETLQKLNAIYEYYTPKLNLLPLSNLQSFSEYQSIQDPFKHLKEKLNELDKKSGSLLMHLPNFGPNLIAYLENEQRLCSIVLKNEQERTSVKLLPASCHQTTTSKTDNCISL